MTDGLNQSRRVGKETSTTMTDISNAIPFFFHLLFDQPNMAALWELVKGDDTWFPSFPVACVRVQNWVLLHVSCKDGVSFLFSFLFFVCWVFFLSLVWGTTGKRNERRTNWRPRRELPRLRIHYERRCLFLFQWDGSFFLCVCVCLIGQVLVHFSR